MSNIDYPGGIDNYIKNGKNLLKNVDHNKKKIEICDGYSLSIHKNKEDYIKYEKIGMKSIDKTVFVLVAGGLGERLGYHDIKIKIVSNSISNLSFLDHYVTIIKNLCTKPCIVIMTSDDTHSRTINYLSENSNFGLLNDELYIIKQNKVPCFLNKNGDLAYNNKGDLIMKPHGHGDVHMLLYQNGLVDIFYNLEKKWIVFFQDTNILTFDAVVPTIGISSEKDIDFNFITTNRKPGEAVGCIVTLHDHVNGSKKTTCVEYNQIESYLNGQPEPMMDNQFSIYPGNTNILVLKLDQYREKLILSNGLVPEFINPKYESDKITFKSPARLETMMQEFSIFYDYNRVSYTNFDKESCYSVMKNDLASAVTKPSYDCILSCEFEYHRSRANLFKRFGCQLEEPIEKVINGIKVLDGPKIYYSPRFAKTYYELEQNIGKNIKLSRKSVLIIDGPIYLENIDLDGTLIVQASEKCTINNLTIKNDGWEIIEANNISGFSLIKYESDII